MKTKWKLLGLAGAASVAGAGVLIARNERQRRAYEPEELREQLLARHAAIASTAPLPLPDQRLSPWSRVMAWWGARRER